MLDRFLIDLGIDFWSMFDRFLVDVWSLFGRPFFRFSRTSAVAGTQLFWIDFGCPSGRVFLPTLLKRSLEPSPTLPQGVKPQTPVHTRFQLIIGLKWEVYHRKCEYLFTTKPFFKPTLIKLVIFNAGSDLYLSLDPMLNSRLFPGYFLRDSCLVPA